MFPLRGFDGALMTGFEVDPWPSWLDEGSEAEPGPTDPVLNSPVFMLKSKKKELSGNYRQRSGQKQVSYL
jgi:hypothetical protein